MPTPTRYWLRILLLGVLLGAVMFGVYLLLGAIG